MFLDNYLLAINMQLYMFSYCFFKFLYLYMLSPPVTQMVPEKPIFIITWEGKDPSLPSLMLNSHIDVVPVFPVGHTYICTCIIRIVGCVLSSAKCRVTVNIYIYFIQECWKHDPFEAVKEDNGNIFARGSQDMKCVGQQ